MKKIGIVCYPTFGGSGIVATELGKALSEKNYFVHFISYERPVRLGTLKKNFSFHEVKIPSYPLFHYPPYELALTAKIVEVVEEKKLDLLHVHYAVPHAYAAVNAKSILRSRGINIPIVTTLHGTDITLVGKSPFVLSAVNYAINESDCITAVSSYLKEETLRSFDIKKEIHIIPNFIDFNYYKLGPKKNKKEKKILSHISNFRPVKRVFDVIEIFKKVNKEIDCLLYMVGDGPDLKECQELVKKYNLSNNIFFVGKSQEINEILLKTDIFLLPSEKESFGLVALEAMMFSVPVITTEGSGVSDLIIHEKNGFCRPVGDVDSMSADCMKLLSESSVYDSFSYNSYLRAKEFNVDVVLPIYERIYNNF